MDEIDCNIITSTSLSNGTTGTTTTTTTSTKSANGEYDVILEEVFGASFQNHPRSLHMEPIYTNYTPSRADITTNKSNRLLLNASDTKPLLSVGGMLASVIVWDKFLGTYLYEPTTRQRSGNGLFH